MSTPEKLRGGSDSELTRFKKLWRDSLAEPAREFWRQLFVSDATQAEIRKQIFGKLKIKLDYDNQLNAFRDWELDQRKRDLQAERMIENERRLKSEHPDWTKDQVREGLLKAAYEESLATGDFKLGLATVDRDLKSQATEIDKRKLILLEKKAAQADATEKVLTDSELSPEQREQRIREIYGRA